MITTILWLLNLGLAPLIGLIGYGLGFLHAQRSSARKEKICLDSSSCTPAESQPQTPLSPTLFLGEPTSLECKSWRRYKSAPPLPKVSNGSSRSKALPSSPRTKRRTSSATLVQTVLSPPPTSSGAISTSLLTLASNQAAKSTSTGCKTPLLLPESSKPVYTSNEQGTISESSPSAPEEIRTRRVQKTGSIYKQPEIETKIGEACSGGAPF